MEKSTMRCCDPPGGGEKAKFSLQLMSMMPAALSGSRINSFRFG